MIRYAVRLWQPPNGGDVGVARYPTYHWAVRACRRYIRGRQGPAPLYYVAWEG